ncbi:hypothetical protein QWY99_11125 [Flavobacterium branchiarum]|uniref:Uncharacterized protein n=1 Tax=Flavobacterium branchiarum TaxID=1114870 RepID=A0ABV5FG02_9FLAO|nr:hypothetical protein [Flavobacterium branchiarum]MDN3673606.1 hypothetical protein [Flavobacterium branchiarum]
MKKTLIITILLLSFINLNAQTSKEEQIITAIKLETDKIILNDKLAYNYSRNNNDFIISDLDGKELIKGSITSLGDGNFSSILTFVTIGKEFSNAKIIGRQEIIFALCNNNVITKNFKIDKKKLRLFFEKYNELK